MRLFPDDSIAAVPHLFNQSPPASSHSEGEVRVEFEEVVGDVGEVWEDARAGQRAREEGSFLCVTVQFTIVAIIYDLKIFFGDSNSIRETRT